MPTNSGLPRLEKSIDAMGSNFSIVLYGRDRERMEAAVTATIGEIRRLDEMLSIYQPRSEWSRMNREAALGPVQVSDETFQLLSRCLDFSLQSDGAFDVSVGALVKTWGFGGGDNRVPSQAEISAALAHVGWRNIVLDGRAGTVRFLCRNLAVNPGGIGKGYAVDRVADVLRRHGIDSALVAA